MEECEINLVNKFQETANQINMMCTMYSNLERECEHLQTRLEDKQNMIHALLRFLYSKGLMSEFKEYTEKKYQQAYDRQDEVAKKIFGESLQSEYYSFK